MSNIQTSITRLETALKNAKQGSKPENNSIRAIICIMAILLTVSIILLPDWVSFLIIGLTVIFIWAISTPRNTATPDLDSLTSEIDALRLAAGDLTTTISQKESIIDVQKAEIDRLTKSLTSATSQPINPSTHPLIHSSTSQSDQVPAGHFRIMLGLLQLLDNTAQDFGEDCEKYIKKEISKTLQKCRMRFEDYSEEMADCYETETAPTITKIDYSLRAILSNETNKVILKGQAFLPPKHQ